MKDRLLNHIRAVGPITLYDILGWLGEQSTLKTHQQVALFQKLCLEKQIVAYDTYDPGDGHACPVSYVVTGQE